VTDRLDLFSLHVLASVGETGSFSRSALLLHLTTSAVSKRIAELEARLRVRLVVRGREGVELTAAGAAVAACAADVADRVAAMAREVAAAEAGGVVRIVANTTALLLGLGEELVAFRAAHPGIRVELAERISQDAVADVLAGRADLGIAAASRIGRQLATVPWRRTRMVLVVPAAHPLAGAGEIAWAEAAPLPQVGRIAGSALMVPEGLLPAPAAMPGLATAVRSFDSMVELVRAGAGLGLLPAPALERRPVEGLVAVRLTDDWAGFELPACHDPVVVPKPPAAALLRFLQARAATPS
jgi:DNA-binding transcriptional LysR family regulator